MFCGFEAFWKNQDINCWQVEKKKMFSVKKRFSPKVLISNVSKLQPTFKQATTGVCIHSKREFPKFSETTNWFAFSTKKLVENEKAIKCAFRFSTFLPFLTQLYLAMVLILNKNTLTSYFLKYMHFYALLTQIGKQNHF